jgi:WD40 repeat protein
MATDDSQRVSARAREILHGHDLASDDAQAEAPPPQRSRPHTPGRPHLVHWRRSPQPLTTVPHRKAVNDVAFSADGEYLATGSAKSARVLRIANQTVVATFEHPGWLREVERCVFSPDGAYLATCSTGSRVELWELSSGRSVAPSAPAYQSCEVAFTADGRYLAVTSQNAAAIVTVPAWAVVEVFTAAAPIRALALSPDGHTLALATWQSGVEVWDVGAKRLSHRLESSNHKRLRISPDGRYLAGGGPFLSADGMLWDLAEGKEVGPSQDFAGCCPAFHPSGDYLAAPSKQLHIRLWTIPDLTEVAAFPVAHGVSAVTFSPDGRHLAMARGKNADIWDVAQAA